MQQPPRLQVLLPLPDAVLPYLRRILARPQCMHAANPGSHTVLAHECMHTLHAHMYIARLRPSVLA